MKDSFIIEGKKYISSKRASAISDYSSDYIGQLCRANKLDCKMIGRAWFVTEESVHLHKAIISREESVRNRIENLKGKVDEVSKNTFTKVVVNKDSTPAISSSPVTSPITNISTASASSVPTPTPAPAIPWTITQKVSSIKSPYVYSDDNRPLLPELKKKEIEKIISSVVETKKQEVSKNVSKEVVAVSAPIVSTLPISTPSISEKKSSAAKTVSISESLIIKNSISYFNLTRQIILQRVIAPALVLLVMFGFGTGTYIVADKIEDNISPELADSAIMVTANIYDAIDSAFLTVKNGYNNVVAFFTSPAKLAMDVPREFGEVRVSKVTPNGIVLSSSVGSEQGDEDLKNKIKGSFSDDVEINPDNSGTAGVITPVFKDTRGKDFVYVMVPVKEKDNKDIQ